MLHDLAEQAALIWAQHNALSQHPDKFGASVRQVFDAVLSASKSEAQKAASEAPRSESCEEPQSAAPAFLLLIQLLAHSLKQGAADAEGSDK